MSDQSPHASEGEAFIGASNLFSARSHLSEIENLHRMRPEGWEDKMVEHALTAHVELNLFIRKNEFG